MSFFSNIPYRPIIKENEIYNQFVSDPSSDKLYLASKILVEEDGTPVSFPVVKKLEHFFAFDILQTRLYLPETGYTAFTNTIGGLLFGKEHPVLIETKVVIAQCLGDTSSIRLGAEFLMKCVENKTIYTGDTLYGVLKLIFSAVGFKECYKYRYWDNQRKRLNFDGMIEDLKGAVSNSTVILNTCAHPVGTDLSRSQWKQLAEVMKEKNLLPFFIADWCATGNLLEDYWVLGYFAQFGLEMVVAHSLGELFNLSEESIGVLCVVMNDENMYPLIKLLIADIIKSLYFSPPSFGCRIITAILNTPKLKAEWLESLKKQVQHCYRLRKSLYEHLFILGVPGDWSFILEQKGYYCYLGLTSDQVEFLACRHHIYTLPYGRINIGTLIPKSIGHLAIAINHTLKEVSPDSNNS